MPYKDIEKRRESAKLRMRAFRKRRRERSEHEQEQGQQHGVTGVTLEKTSTPQDYTQHVQILFNQILKDFFPTISPNSIRLELKETEADWQKALQDNFPNEDNSRTESFCNYEQGIVYLPMMTLPDVLIRRLMIHELAHVVVRKKGHDRDWLNIMLECIRKAKKNGDAVLCACLRADALDKEWQKIKPLIPMIQNILKQKSKPKLRFPQEYRRWDEQFKGEDTDV